MSKELIARLRHIYADGDPITEEAADCIEHLFGITEQLRQRVAEFEKERDSFKDAAEYNKRRADYAESQRDELKQQRDELVAAMYLITKRPVIEAFSIAEAAIASVKEKS